MAPLRQMNIQGLSFRAHAHTSSDTLKVNCKPSSPMEHSALRCEVPVLWFLALETLAIVVLSHSCSNMGVKVKLDMNNCGRSVNGAHFFKSSLYITGLIWIGRLLIFLKLLCPFYDLICSPRHWHCLAHLEKRTGKNCPAPYWPTKLPMGGKNPMGYFFIRSNKNSTIRFTHFELSRTSGYTLLKNIYEKSRVSRLRS